MGKISAKAPTKWSHLPNFHFGVSMGSRLHTGLHLESIVYWANEHGFEQGLIDVSDTLNRYNHMLSGMSESDAQKVAREEGRDWYNANRPILENLRMPYEVVFWDYWLNHPDFAQYNEAFHAAFHADPAFRTAVTKDIQHHYMRKYGHNLHERSQSDIELSKQFYLEELAVLSIQFESYPCAEIYPGRELECAKLVRSGSVKNVPLCLQNAVYAKIHVIELDASKIA